MMRKCEKCEHVLFENLTYLKFIIQKVLKYKVVKVGKCNSSIVFKCECMKL